MGGHVRNPAARGYEAQLAKLAARLASATTADELGELARAYHGVTYALGHDIPAILADPSLVARAAHGELAARERACEAYARDRNLRHAIFHLFEALARGLERADRERVALRAAALLDDPEAEAAGKLRAAIAALPADDTAARDAFARQLDGLKHAFDWNRLPRGPG